MKNILSILLLFIGSIYTIIDLPKTFDREPDIVINPARELINKVVEKAGSMEKLKNLKDVQYRYTFINLANQKKDVSTEKYLFNGELSYASYDQHQVFIMPGKAGKVVQQYNGDTTYVTLADKPVSERIHVGAADFVRKANFYWFAMIAKLQDKGVNFEMMTDQQLKGTSYKRIRMDFDENIGEVQDDFILYINPETMLIDQFLFTVKRSSKFPVPLLMEVSYEEISGIYLMTDRKVIQADWEGIKIGSYLFRQLSEEIRFNNGFKNALFNPK